MSTWKPTEGMRLAEMLVQVLEVEAVAAGSKITPLFRHRMVEQIGKTIDSVMPAAAIANGHIDGSVEIDVFASNEAMDDAFDALVSRNAMETKAEKAASKANGAKKPGRRGRPSNAEKAARAAARA